MELHDPMAWSPGAGGEEWVELEDTLPPPDPAPLCL